MRPGCCCTTRLRHTEGQGLHSQPSNSPSPTSIHTCISISSTIQYYPEICRRYSAPPNPSVTIICFRYRSTEPAMAAPASIGHSRIRYCKCRARLGPGAALGGVRWSHGAGSPSVATCPQPRMEHWSTLHTLLQVGIIAHCMALSSRQCDSSVFANSWNRIVLFGLQYSEKFQKQIDR